jgi:hypothetical protein
MAAPPLPGRAKDVYYASCVAAYYRCSEPHILYISRFIKIEGRNEHQRNIRGLEVHQAPHSGRYLLVYWGRSFLLFETLTGSMVAVHPPGVGDTLLAIY